MRAFENDAFRTEGYVPSSIKILSAEEEQNLWQDWFNPDPSPAADKKRTLARDKILTAHLPLCAYIAREFSRFNDHISLYDFFGGAEEEMVTQFGKFDPSKESRFSTFIGSRIKYKLMAMGMNDSGPFKLGMNKCERALFSNWGELNRKIIQENPSITTHGRFVRIAEALSLKKSSHNAEPHHVLSFVMKKAACGATLNRMIGDHGYDDGVELQELIAAQGTTPEERLAASEYEYQYYLAEQAFSILTDRERTVIQSRYLAGDEQSKTLSDLAPDFKVSCERIRQIEVAALKKMRKFIETAPRVAVQISEETLDL